MAWEWLRRVGRFIDSVTDRLMGKREQRDLVDSELARHADNTRSLAERLASGTMTVGQWHEAMRAEIKHAYIQQYLLGRGGLDQMTSVDYGSIGGMLREQYRHLDAFAAEIAAGRLSEGQIAARSAMYANSAREAFGRAQGRVAADTGKAEVRWILGRSEHCPDCLAFADEGWQPNDEEAFGGAIPGDGSTVCLTNCQCLLDYR